MCDIENLVIFLKKLSFLGHFEVIEIIAAETEKMIFL
jgi:hypothetical protein